MGDGSRNAETETGTATLGRSPRINASSTRGLGAFHLLRIRISTNAEAFIPAATHSANVHMRPHGPQIAVPNWLIEWSKSRDLFLSLAHNPWVYRPN